MNGIIVYRVPAPHELLGVSMSSLDHYDTMNFIISVMAASTGKTV
jgi:hypothetical protein